MSKADKIFAEMCQDITANGYSKQVVFNKSALVLSQGLLFF